MTNTARIAAITGAGGALGGAVARALVAKGYKVALFDVERTEDRLKALVDELGRDRALSHASDFASAEAWSVALDAVKAAFGGPPLYAALAAGGWAGGVPLHETGDDSSYQRMITENVDSTYRALRALLPSMVDARRGSIVVVGSRAAVRPWTSAGSAAYSAAKAAVVAIAQSVAEEVLEFGVRINAVLPSTLDTPANRTAMPGSDTSRWVALDSAAGVIAFFLSDESRDVSGAAIPIYGRA